MTCLPGPQREAVLRLLEDNQLPTADLAEVDLSDFLGCGNPSDPDGVVGLEVYEDSALLRSLVVHARVRKGGCGSQLLAAAEDLARTRGVQTLYLLTTTAAQFFERHGYVQLERASAPAAIRQTREFGSLCPDDATFMAKSLAADQGSGSSRASPRES